MKVDSRLIMAEEVENRERRFGSNLSYYPAFIKAVSGQEVPALFTADQLNDAIERAARNPEDIPEEQGSFFNWLFS